MTETLAEELDRKLEAFLNAKQYRREKVVAEVALRNALWDNKAGIIAGLNKPGVAQCPGLPTDEMVEAAAREMWNDRDARHGGSWDSRGADEVCVIQTKATARAALIAALAQSPDSSTLRTNREGK